MDLMHYTSAPFTFDPDRTYEQIQPHTFGKPVGLWVSVQGEDDWESWCQSEEFHLAALAHPHQVKLADSANVLYLTSVQDLREFTETYTQKDDSEFAKKYPMLGGGIDWSPVVDKYDGLIIAPYQWECRYGSKTDWYYGWDCASGCIWRPSAIESVEAVVNA